MALLVGAIAAPATAYFAINAYEEYRGASVRHSYLKRQQRELDQYSAQVDDYNRFAARVEKFVAQAHAAGVADEAWDRHQVDIKERSVDFDELDQFLAGAGSGENFYFLPSKLTIQAPGATTTGNPFRRGLRSTSTNTVKVSLQGNFLVRIK
jgi:hypothetical protein